jgi:hypothetical protein
MKTKEEILKMSKKEINQEFLNLKNKANSNCSNCYDCFDCYDCSKCYNCSNCSDCFDCSNCFYCYKCKSVSNLRYAICNVELTKEEYEAKMKDIKKEE